MIQFLGYVSDLNTGSSSTCALGRGIFSLSSSAPKRTNKPTHPKNQTLDNPLTRERPHGTTQFFSIVPKKHNYCWKNM